MPKVREINRDFFKKWSPEMSYVLGFLFADGNIIKTKRNTHFVAFYTSDLDLLSSIRNSMSSDHTISERKGMKSQVYVLQIGGKELFNDLIRLGLTPHKARRMKLPKIPKKLINDFIRGYFDGDGNVWSGFINKKRKTPTNVLGAYFTCASSAFLKELSFELKKLGVKAGSIYTIKNKNCSRLQYSTLDALKLCEIMYNKPHKLFLPRKKAVFEKFIKMRP